MWVIGIRYTYPALSSWGLCSRVCMPRPPSPMLRLPQETRHATITPSSRQHAHRVCNRLAAISRNYATIMPLECHAGFEISSLSPVDIVRSFPSKIEIRQQPRHSKRHNNHPIKRLPAICNNQHAPTNQARSTAGPPIGPTWEVRPLPMNCLL